MASRIRAPAIGIDLGTTFSCVAVLTSDGIQVLQNREGKNTLPSYVAYTEHGRLLGEAARNRALFDPENTIHSMKRLIGRTLNDVHVKADVKTFPFKVVGDSWGNPRIQVKFRGQVKHFSPEEISAVVLAELKFLAEEFLGTKVKDAVITVPAYFTNAQRKATIDAGRIAGLNVIATINEPTAAALAYGFSNPIDTKPSIVLVFDFGGGTFDVSVVKIQNGDVEVLSSDGHGHLGGEDIDELLVKHFNVVFMKKHQIDLFKKIESANEKEAREAKRAIRRLRFACEKTKIKLSSERDTCIDLNYLFDEKNLVGKVTRQYFENLCEDLIRETLSITMRSMGTVNLTPDDISEIILVGGSTHIPKVTDVLRDLFPQKEPCKSINPDEAVAVGAAIKAAMLNGTDLETVRTLRLRDVLPMSLGIESYGGVMATVIKRNTLVPFQRSKIFSTNKDNQTQVNVKIYEGERHMSKYNNYLGEFLLIGIPPAPKGVPQIEVIFEVDANGILKVKATDLVSERMNYIKITNSEGRLNPSDMARALEEAEKMRDEDLKFRDQVNARVRLEDYAYKIDKALQNSRIREKLDAELLRTITIKVKESLTLSQSFKEPRESNYREKYNELEKLWLPAMIKICNPNKQGNDDAPVLHSVDDVLEGF